MKKIVYRRQLNNSERAEVLSLAKEFSLQEETATVLYTRGVTTSEGFRHYLNAGKENFIDPFLMKNMDVVTHRLRQAAENGETVVVYGDYDVDGICATAIMMRALAKIGIKAIPVIPERDDGYGLTESLIEMIAETYFPDLIITVDCGISNKDEVELIKDAGIDVLITDHHELPEELPDAPIVNPKLKDQDYPYDNLCGAGVAFKIAVALCGEWAYSLVDFACLATVADSMTILGENRDIVAEGLKVFASPTLRPQFKLLLSGSREINETTLAFTVSPRLNAAGRMGDVASALYLFVTEDEEEMHEYAEKLAAYNVERQTACDEMYKTAKRLLQKKGAFTPSIVLYDEGWKSGFVGIVASRLAEEYARPVVLFTDKGNGQIKGSVRSVDNLNIFEALSAVQSQIVEFGGHAQAAGVTVCLEQLQAFEDALNAYLLENTSPSSYEPTVYCEKLLEEPYTMTLAKDLKKLEPFGVGNRKPLYVVQGKEVSVKALKAGSPHLSLSTPQMEMLYFNGEKFRGVLESPATKFLVFEPNISVFNRKESLKGYLREFITDLQIDARQKLYIFRNNLAEIATIDPVPYPETVSDKELETALNSALNQRYGTAILSYGMSAFSRFPQTENLPKYLFTNNYNNLHNCCIVSPFADLDTSEYHTVIYLDKPLVYTGKFRGQAVIMGKENPTISLLKTLSLDRSVFSAVYTVIRDAGRIHAFCSVDAYEKMGMDFDPYQFIFCVECFIELGLIESFGGTLSAVKNVKNPLENSKIYQKVKALQESLC